MSINMTGVPDPFWSEKSKLQILSYHLCKKKKKNLTPYCIVYINYECVCTYVQVGRKPLSLPLERG